MYMFTGGTKTLDGPSVPLPGVTDIKDTGSSQSSEHEFY